MRPGSPKNIYYAKQHPYFFFFFFFFLMKINITIAHVMRKYALRISFTMALWPTLQTIYELTIESIYVSTLHEE